MKSKYQWNIQPPITPDIMSQYPELNKTILQLLWNRGIHTPQDIDNFLNADYGDLLDPFLILDMKKSIERIITALQNKEKIIVFGDYDADGVTGATILYSTLELIHNAIHQQGQMQADITDLITVYIPDRHTEGYGLTDDATSTLLTLKPNLILTVDCGVTSKVQIESLQNAGIDVIVIDHHSVPEIMPPAFGIIVPKRKGDPYPFKDLCGAGLAFKVATALLSEIKIQSTLNPIPQGYEKWLLDLACIGTIADMVPLIGENRILVRYGLYVLAKTRNIGLRALMDEAGIIPQVNELDGQESLHISVYSVGFQIAPRINSAGRIAHANQAFALFTTKDTEEAKQLAQDLQILNEKRKLMTEQVFNEVKERVSQYENMQEVSVIFEGDPDWPIGVLGIVASRLVEQYYRPVVLYQTQPHKHIASARSIPGINLAEIIHSIKDELISGGGHSQAAGLSFDTHKVATIKDAFIRHIRETVDIHTLYPQKTIDLEIPAQEIDWELYDVFYRLAPFGMNNPNPLFVVRMMRIQDMKTIGADNTHIKLTLVSEAQVGKPVTISAIGFSLGFIMEHLHRNDLVDVVFHLEVNEWQGNRSLQMHIVDIASSN